MKDVNQVESPLASLATWREENSFHAKSPRLYVLTGHEPQASSQLFDSVGSTPREYSWNGSHKNLKIEQE